VTHCGTGYPEAIACGSKTLMASITGQPHTRSSNALGHAYVSIGYNT